MQYVNDDMDELFRSAAENYPLQEKGADWNKVAWALENEGEAMPLEQKRGNKNLVWLLCLMPAFLCNKDLAPSRSSQQAVTISATSISAKATPFNADQNDPKITETRTDATYTPQIHRSSPSRLTSKPVSAWANTIKDKSIHTVEATATNNNNIEVHTIPQSNDLLPVGDEQAKKSPATANKTNKEEAPLNKKNEAPVNKKTGKKFYAVLLAGLDASSVRMQKVEHAGHHYGGLLGYKLDSKWSLEAGFLIEKKYYYTGGEYFNTSGIYLPPNSKITEVAGDCNMFEIPINLRYDFSANKNSSWSAAAGLSSYLMKKEHYDYLYYYGNSNTQAYHEKTYKDETRDLFSILQLSAGYTRKIDKTISVRIEPYLKLPLSGIGFGKLPLISTGVNLGIVKDLF